MRYTNECPVRCERRGGRGEETLLARHLPTAWSPPKHLVVHVTNRCNLACPYCFNKSRSAEDVIPVDVRAAVRSLLDPEAEPIQLSFIGGEPLLKWQAIRESLRLVATDRKLFPVVALTTNGTLLTSPVIRELAAIRARVIVSLEGTAKRHLRLRPPMTTRQYQRLIERVHLLVASRGARVAARMTVWGKTENLVREVAAVRELGFRRILVFPDAGLDSATCKAQMTELSAAFKDDVVEGRLVLEPLSGRRFQLTDGLTRPGCGAGRTFLVLAPDRRIYPCHRHVGASSFAIGALDRGLDAQRLKRWVEGMQAMQGSCDACPAAQACRFPCAYPRFPGAGRAGEAWCGWMLAAARAAQQLVPGVPAGKG